MSRTHYQRGISLIEILVAMAIGAVLLNAVINVFISNSTATRTIAGYTGLQENARIGVSGLTESLRNAGHFGGLDGDEITVIGGLSLTGIGSCNQAWIVDTSTPIQGYEGAANISSVTNLPSGCIPNAQYVPDSDIVSVRYGAATGAMAIGSVNTSSVYLRSSVGGGVDGGELFLGSDAMSTQVGDGLDGVGTYNYQYKNEVYFLRPCSALNGTVCDDGLQTLVRYSLDGSSLVVEPIAEGVEQFQVEYGVDTRDENGDGSKRDYVADVYQTAASVGNWNEVVSVRFSVVIRSETRENGFTDTEIYDLAGGYSYTPDSSVAAYHRKTYTKVIQLRNMSRG